MKNLLIIAFTFILGTCVVAQNEAMDGKPVMNLETTTVDYGTIDQHSDPLRKVSFTNTGDAPLIIKNAKGSCGCTVPTWPREPIMPGETSEIEVRYDTKRVGSINKTIKITTNEGGDPHVIRVQGKILAKDQKEALPKKDKNLIGG